MNPSFKFKIATLSFAISGALLVAFGAALFTRIHASALERVDRELRALVQPSLRGDHPDSYWRTFSDSLSFIHGDGATRVALVVTDSAGHTLCRTDHAWPALSDIPAPELSPEQMNTSRGFFLRNDRDGDGLVAADEFDGPPPAFDRADKNFDGFIDAEEARALPPPPRRNAPFEAGPQRRDAPGPAPSEARLSSVTYEGATYRVGAFRNPNVVIIAAMNLDDFNAEVNEVARVFMIGLPFGLVLLGAMGWFLADRAMKPIDVIAATMEGITARGLNRRVPEMGADAEMARLVKVSNGMLDRLEKSYHQATRFSADAAHELQTPLTILQGELDNAIQSAPPGSEEQQCYGMLMEETSNLKAVVQKLLLLAHADEGRLNLNPKETNVSALVADAAEDIEIMAPELDIQARIEPDVLATVDATLMIQVIRNMTSNAAKYSAERGRVVFTLEKSADHVRFTLANTAPPIPDADRGALFERFHRVDKARSTAGSGLGLTLAREIARAHGGELVLDPYEDGMVSFTLALPTSSPMG